jgi:hypothetical protein
MKPLGFKGLLEEPELLQNEYVPVTVNGMNWSWIEAGSLLRGSEDWHHEL